MSPSDHTLRAGRVQLLDITEGILEELLDVALADAAPDDVTPPLGKLTAGTRNGSAGSASITGPLLPDWTARLPRRRGRSAATGRLRDPSG
jgi:hypothetical protein